MNLKPIEMQIALPRTADVGQQQQQQQNVKPTTDQVMAMHQSVKEAEGERKKTVKSEETESTLIRDEEQHGQQRESRQRENEKSTADQEEGIHPYKGHHFDVSL